MVHCAMVVGGLVWLGMLSLGISGKENGEKGGGSAPLGRFIPGKAGQFVTAAPLVSCPEGYNLVDDHCERLDEYVGELNCPKHAELIGNSCFASETVPAREQCPAGSIPGRRGCETEEAVVPLVECRKGWSEAPDGRRCMRAGKGKGRQLCPDGWDNRHGLCTLEESSAGVPGCPDGYVLQTGDRKHPMCISVELVPPEVYCPKGWVAQGGACLHIRQKAKEYENCPAGYEQVHKGSCERIITQSVDVVCPPGHVLIPSGKKGRSPTCKALEYEAVVPRCAKGFEFQNNRCQKHNKGAISLECQKGYELTPEGRCYMETEMEANSQCAPGSVENGKHCIMIDEEPISLECPKASALVAGRCVHHEIVAPRMLCPDGFRRSKKGGACQVEHTIVAEPNCPFQSRLTGKHCLSRLSEPASPICKKGELTAEGCVEDLKKAPKSSCPQGFRKSKGSCARETALAPVFVCPPDSILQERNQCLSTRASGPRFRCPEGWMLDAHNNCFLSDVAEPILGCPLNTVLTNGECYRAEFTSLDGRKKKQ